MTGRGGRPARESVVPALPRGRHANIQVLRAVAVLAIFAQHFLGFWHAAGRPLDLSGGVVGSIDRTLRFDAGFWGVSTFVVLSAVGLVAAADRAASDGAFYRRRLSQIYPLFWWIAAPAIVVLLVVGRMAVAQLWQAPLWLTGATIALPGRAWPISAPWWFVTLILQIYLVFPLLMRAARRWGLAALLAGATAIDAACVLAVAHLPLGHPAAQFLGLAFVGCRLLEVAAGLALGELYWAAASGRRVPLRRVAGVAAGVVGGFAALKLAGRPMLWPTLAFAAVALVLAPPVARACGARVAAPLRRLGDLSYPFYLVHALLIPPAIALVAMAGLGLEPVAAAASLAVAVAVAAFATWSLSFARARAAARTATSGARRRAPAPDAVSIPHVVRTPDDRRPATLTTLPVRPHGVRAVA